MGNLLLLLVEDDEDDAELTVEALESAGLSVAFARVDTEDDMRTALQLVTSWDVIVSDSSMPLFSAPAALAVLRETTLDIPFIIVSGTITERTAAEAMKMGARDVVVKGDLQRLAPVIERERREHEERKARALAGEADKPAEPRPKRRRRAPPS